MKIAKILALLVLATLILGVDSPNKKPEIFSDYSIETVPFFSSKYWLSFNDNYNNPLFWMWLMDHPKYVDIWIYHHRGRLDPDRYQALRVLDRELDLKMLIITRSKVKVDPSYSPPGIDASLQYAARVILPEKPTDVRENKTIALYWEYYAMMILGVITLGFFAYIHTTNQEWDS